MAWRVARSLDQLLAQLNVLAPHRSKVSDGSIGDPAHSSRTSDHNPDPSGVVRARDFTHDPAGGLDCHWLAGRLVAARDPRIKYVIWNRRILSGAGGPSPWVWRNYTGVNPHTKHLHVSVVSGAAADTLTAWNLGPTEEEDMDQAEKDTLNALAWRMHAWINGLDAVPNRTDVSPAGVRGEQMWFVQLVKRLEIKVDNLAGELSDDEANILAAIRALPAPGDVDEAAVAAALAPVLAPLIQAGATPEQVEAAMRAVFASAGDPNT